jgi:hypothetical protein
MPDQIIDRDAIIEKAARAEWVACWPKVPWSDDAAGEWLRITAAAIEPIADDLLAPIEALLASEYDRIACDHTCSMIEVRGAARLHEALHTAIAAIREAVRA